MATHLRIFLLIRLLQPCVLKQEVKPVVTKKEIELKQRTKLLEESLRELKGRMREQEEKLKEQEQRLKALEECKACSKTKELNKTLNELQEKIDTKPDMDECCSNTGRCDVNAVCSTVNGSHTCTCKAGFSGNGTSCVDIDECISGTHDCHGSASCINTRGSYHCLCNYPYKGAGRTWRHSAKECQNYQNLTNANRKVSYHRVGWSRCDKNLGPGWFRFQGAAGTKMVTSCPPTERCDASVTGWLNGAHPSIDDGSVVRRVCFHWKLGCCTWSTNIQVRNCGSFYVYYLNGTPTCNLRYCGTD